MRLALAWTLLCLALFSVPGQDLPPDLVSFDKVAHLGLFAVLGALWMRALSLSGWPYVLIGGALFAIGTELYQGWLPWERHPDPYDVLADTVGLVLGMAGYAFVRRRAAQEKVADRKQL